MSTIRQINAEVDEREKPKTERAKGVEKKGERRVEVEMGVVAYLAGRNEGGGKGELARTNGIREEETKRTVCEIVEESS